MCSNEIIDINVLVKLNLKELNELYLNLNKIADINVLDKIKFENLKKLDLTSNPISNNLCSSTIIKLKANIHHFYQ